MLTDKTYFSLSVQPKIWREKPQVPQVSHMFCLFVSSIPETACQLSVKRFSAQ